MNISFNQEQIDLWASFSGDYNPIHINKEVANSYGLDGVVVHGMLAMMPIKENMLSMQWGGDWVCWDAVLRNAVPLKSKLLLKTRNVSNGNLKFILSDEHEKKFITGSCKEVNADTSRVNYNPVYTISAERLFNRKKEFAQKLPGAINLLVYIDALVFSEYLTLHSLNMFSDDVSFTNKEKPHAENVLDKRSAQGGSIERGAFNGLSEHSMVMQTTHTVTVSRVFLDMHSLESSAIIEYDVIKVDQISSQESIHAVVEMPVWIDGSLGMIIQVGLMVKNVLTN